MQSASTYRRWYTSGFLITAFLISSTIASADAVSHLAGFSGPCGNPKVLCACKMASLDAANSSVPLLITSGQAQPSVSRSRTLTSPSGGSGNFVNITNFAFTPSDITITQGSAVQWTVGSGTHTTTSDTGVWNSGNLSTGNSFSVTFNTPGNFPYHCGIHSFMTGVVHVQAIPEPASLALLGLFCSLLPRRRRLSAM